MENPSTNDAGQGNLTGLWFEIFTHAKDLLAAIGPIPAPGPVVEQHRELVVVCGCDDTPGLINDKAAIGVFLIVAFKKPLGNLPQSVIQLLGLAVNILWRELHLVRQFFGKSGKEHIFGGSDCVTVVLLIGVQGALKVLLHLGLGPQALGNDRKGPLHIVGKSSQYIIGDSKDAIRNQHPLVDQLQLANIGEVVFVNEGHG